ncbi:MAG: tetratricopeptide repeat protein, partial [bacterium]|nr:tetratricopeptide repeat protein [bacterium]
AETLERLRRIREAILWRERLLELRPAEGDRYAPAARIALAEERCRAGEDAECLRLTAAGKRGARVFGDAYARYLQGWALERSGKPDEAMAQYAAVEKAGGNLAARAALARAHLLFQQKQYAEAEKAYLKVSEMVPPGSSLAGEALHGIGWARLRLSRPEEAGRAFDFFLQKHGGHSLKTSAALGRLAARMEVAVRKGEKIQEIQKEVSEFSAAHKDHHQLGALQLQLAWALFRTGKFADAARHAAGVSDAYPLGRIYRMARVVEGLGLYHGGEARKAYGVLRLGAESPPGDPGREAEREIARSAAMATAFAAFRLKDFATVMAVLQNWAFPAEGEKGKPAAAPEAALWFGEAAFEAGDLKTAAAAFAAIPPNSVHYNRARAGLAWIAYRQNKWKEAAAAFDGVFQAAPNGPLASEALARAGDARFNLGDIAGALQVFEKIEKEFTGRPAGENALLQKAKLLFRRDRFSDASKALEEFLGKYPKSAAAVEVEFLRALIPFRMRDYARSRELLLDFVYRRASSAFVPEAYLRIADAFYNEGKYEQADRMYRLMKNRYPDHPRKRDAFYGLILTRFRQKNYSKFLEEAQDFIRAYPQSELSIALAFQVGELHLARGELAGALRSYREVETRYAGSTLAANAILRVAEVHRRRGNFDAALISLESLMEQYPKSPVRVDALFRVGELLAQVGRCDESISRLESFLRQYPRHGYTLLAQFLLGKCAIRTGNEALALRSLRSVSSSADGSGEMRGRAALLLGALLVKQKKFTEAARALDDALRHGSEEVGAEALYSLAELRFMKRDPGAAAEFLKLTYQFPGQTIWVARALGRAGEIYEKSGKRVTAIRIYRKMALTAPPGELRQRAHKALARLLKPSPKALSGQK